MRRPDKPAPVKERVDLIEQVLSPLMIEMMALRLLFRLLFDAEASLAEDEEREPLDILIAMALDDLIEEIDDATEEPEELVRLQTRLAARALLKATSELVDVDDPDGEAHENDNGRR